MNPGDRALLTRVHRWLRRNGWQASMPGWSDGRGRDATVRVTWAEGMVRVTRRDAAGLWPQYPRVYPVDSVREAVDLLVAAGVLPAELSSAYQAGRRGGWNLPEPMTHEQLAELLQEIADRVRVGDSFEGSVEYLMPMSEDNAPSGTYAMVRAGFRVGNRNGQGGFVLVGRQPEQVPA